MLPTPLGNLSTISCNCRLHIGISRFYCQKTKKAAAIFWVSEIGDSILGSQLSIAISKRRVLFMPENGMSVNWLLANLFCKTGVDRVLRFLYDLYFLSSALAFLFCAVLFLFCERSSRNFLRAELAVFYEQSSFILWSELLLFLFCERSSRFFVSKALLFCERSSRKFDILNWVSAFFISGALGNFPFALMIFSDRTRREQFTEFPYDLHLHYRLLSVPRSDHDHCFTNFLTDDLRFCDDLRFQLLFRRFPLLL